MKEEEVAGITGERICSDGLTSLLAEFLHDGQKKRAVFPLLEKINFRSCGELRMDITQKSLFHFPNFFSWKCKVMSSLETLQQRK